MTLSRDLPLLYSQLKREISSQAISKSFKVSGNSQCLWQKAPDFGGQKAKGICSMFMRGISGYFQNFLNYGCDSVFQSVPGGMSVINH